MGTHIFGIHICIQHKLNCVIALIHTLLIYQRYLLWLNRNALKLKQHVLNEKTEKVKQQITHHLLIMGLPNQSSGFHRFFLRLPKLHIVFPDHRSFPLPWSRHISCHWFYFLMQTAHCTLQGCPLLLLQPSCFIIKPSKCYALVFCYPLPLQW